MRKLKKITFTEQFLNENPIGNKWRGIKVFVDGIKMISIDYDGYDLEIVLDGIIPQFLYKSTTKETIELYDFKNHVFKIEDKELAKKDAIKIVKDYFNVFFEKQIIKNKKNGKEVKRISR